MAKLSTVEQAAVHWWAQKRPLEYNRQQHLDNPTINCTSGAEQRLANAVARLVVSQERAAKDKGAKRGAPRP